MRANGRRSDFGLRNSFNLTPGSEQTAGFEHYLDEV